MGQHCWYWYSALESSSSTVYRCTTVLEYQFELPVEACCNSEMAVHCTVFHGYSKSVLVTCTGTTFATLY